MSKWDGPDYILYFFDRDFGNGEGECEQNAKEFHENLSTQVPLSAIRRLEGRGYEISAYFPDEARFVLENTAYEGSALELN